MTKPRVLLIGGSHAEPSHTSALLRAAERCLALRGASTCRWDIAMRPVPPIRPGLAPHELETDVRALVAASRAADALVIGSPLYHNSFSGAVKDALDHLSARELEGKPAALLSHSGGFPSTQALDHLRAVVRALLGLAVPRQVVTVDGDYTLTGDRYVLASEAASARLGALADELLWVAVRLRATPLQDEPDADDGQADGRARAPRALAGANERRS